MIADDVKVISRPYEAGERDRKTLHFRDGAKERAEFRNFAADEDGVISPKYSTVLIASVKLPGWLSYFASLSNPGPFSSMDQLWKNVTRTLKQLVFSLDVECWLSCGGAAPERLNQPGVLDVSADQFVRDFNETFVSPTSMLTEGFSSDETALIEPIRDKNGVAHTLGCINTTYSATGLWHIGGFHCFGVVNSLIKGVIGAKPLTASRGSVSNLVSRDELGRWGKSQLNRLVSSGVDPTARLSAIAHLASIDVDIRQHAIVIADGEPRTLQNIVANLPRSARIFIMGQRVPPPFRKAIFVLNPNFPFFGFGFKDLKRLQYNVRISGGVVTGRESYFEIEGALDAPTNSNSAYGALCEILRNAGFQITTEPPGEYLIGTYRGPRGGRSHLLSRDLVPGKEIKAYGFILKANREKIRGGRPSPRPRRSKPAPVRRSSKDRRG